MNQPADRIFGAVASIGLSAACVMFGLNLVPPLAVAREAQGSPVPWLLIWSFIMITVLTGVILASYLVITGMRGKSE